MDRTKILEELVQIEDQARNSAAKVKEEQARASVAGGEISNLLTQLSSSVNNWTDIPPSNWEAFGGGYANPSYFRDKLGFVHLRGILVPKEGFKDSPTDFTLPFTLQSDHDFPLACSDEGFKLCTMTLRADGSVDLAGGGTNWISLDGITFLATPKQN